MNGKEHALLLLGFVGCAVYAQHGVIREYAALAPRADAVPLRPLADMALTDVSIAVGHDGAYYMTGSVVEGEKAVFEKRVPIWRSMDLRGWKKIREVESGGRRAQAPEIHFLRGRYWLTLGLEGGGTELVSFASTDVARSGVRRAAITEKGFDPSLFLDDDGTFYWVMGAGEVARMKADPMEGNPQLRLYCMLNT